MWGKQRCAYLGCHRSAGDGMGWSRRPPWSAEKVMWVVKQRHFLLVSKYRSLWYIFYRRIWNSNQCFRTRFNWVRMHFVFCIFGVNLFLGLLHLIVCTYVDGECGRYICRYPNTQITNTGTRQRITGTGAHTRTQLCSPSFIHLVDHFATLVSIGSTYCCSTGIVTIESCLYWYWH